MKFDGAAFRRGAKDSIFIAVSIFSYGVLFGVLAAQAGLSSLQATLMSALVLAGAAQFVAIGLWASAALSPLTIIGATLVVNLRYFLMAAVMRPRIKSAPAWQKPLALHLLVDESWALTLARAGQGEHTAEYLIGSGLLCFLGRVAAAAVGAEFGAVIPNPEHLALDFAFTAVFIGLAAGLWRGRSDLLPWLAAGAVALLVQRYLPGTWYIVAGAIAGSLVSAASHAD